MNINSGDLPKALERESAKGVLSPIWIILDNEPLLALEAGDLLRDSAKALGYTERVSLGYSATSDWSGLLDALTSVSLFDDQKLIELRFLSSGPGVKGAKILAEFAKLAPTIDSITTVIYLPSPDYTLLRSAWYKALSTNANVINCEAIARSEYPQWIASRLRQQNQSMEALAMEFFAEQTEGNLLAAKQELMKLALLYPQKELSLQEVQNCVMNVSRYSPDDLIESIGLGDVARVARTINGMQAEDEPLPFILMYLTGYLRDTLSLTLDQRAFVRKNMQRSASALARRSSSAKIANMLTRCADLDRLSKGLTVKNRDTAWSELKTLCVFLAHGR